MSHFKITVETVGAPYGYEEYIKDNEKFSPMQIVYGQDISGKRLGLGVVLAGPIDVPYFEDGVASEFCKTPLDITNPEEWRQTFRCYLVFNLSSQEYVLCNYRSLHLFDEKHPHNAYVPYDIASGHMRVINGLFKLSDCADKPKE